MSEACEEKITLVIRGRSLKVKKTYLCQQSLYFEGMFRTASDFLESNRTVFHVKDTQDYDSFKNVLHFDEKILPSLDMEQILAMLHVANYFLFSSVKDSLVSFLIDSVSDNTCLRIYEGAITIGIDHLANKIFPYCLKNFSIVKESTLQVTSDTILTILKNPNLPTKNEMEVFGAIVKWLEKDKSGSKINEEHLKCLDFSRMSHNDVISIRDHKLVPKKLTKLFTNILGCSAPSHTPENYYRYAEDNIPHSESAICARSFRKDSHLPGGVGFVRRKTTDRLGRKATVKCPVLFAYDTSTRQLKPIEYAVEMFPPNSKSFNGFNVLYHKEKFHWIGGEYNWGRASWMNEINVFDPITKKWEQLASLEKSRRHHCSVWVDDQLFIFGGTAEFRCRLDRVDRYDVIYEHWSEMEKLPEKTSPAICCKHERNVYVFKDSTMMVFDTSRNEWKTIELTPSFTRISSANHDGIRLWVTEIYTCKCFCLIDLELGRAVHTGKFKYNPVDVCVHENVMYSFAVTESGENVVEALSMAKMRELLAQPTEEVVQSDIIMQGLHPTVTFGKSLNESDYSYGTFCVLNAGLGD